jgi:4-amino-4-deoxychorismate lyase
MPSKGPVRGGKQQDLTLIETMRWEPATGFVRFAQHMRRLHRSADALGFLPAPRDLHDQLEAVGQGDQALRVRLEMSFRGRIDIKTTPFTPLSEDTVWRIGIARTRIASDDLLLRHKTNRRDVYELARDEFARDEVDEVLLLNERDEVCEGTISNIFLETADGVLKTPALSCGLLAGILRADLIREGRATAGVLRPSELKATPIYVGNSLRGLIRAVLVAGRSL